MTGTTRDTREPPSLIVNGQPLALAGLDPHTTVLELLRARGLVGTKEGCAEGECGACAVARVEAADPDDPAAGACLRPFNACLALAGALAGAELITVEGLRPRARPEAGPDADAPLHPVQAAMVATGGSQCGYCTPGFVVSLACELYRRERGDGPGDPEAIAGNLCRCTGYRPIRTSLAQLGVPAPDDPLAARRDRPAPTLASLTLTGARPDHRDAHALIRPGSLAELLAVLASTPGAKLVAGGTDVGVEITQRDARWPVLVSLEAVPELRRLTIGPELVEIGAAASLSAIERGLRAAAADADDGRPALPLVLELIPLFSSQLIRNRASFGGNLANASPIGDGAPVLLALDARVELRSAAGARELPLTELFVGYRATALAPGELITRVLVPRRPPTHAHFYKLSKRVLDDISTVAAAFAVDLDPATGAVTRARLAYGGVAATPIRATAAEQALLGQRLDPAHARASVDALLPRLRPLLAQAATPMSDHRGSAAYREAMMVELLRKFAAEIALGRRLGPQPPGHPSASASPEQEVAR